MNKNYAKILSACLCTAIVIGGTCPAYATAEKKVTAETETTAETAAEPTAEPTAETAAETTAETTVEPTAETAAEPTAENKTAEETDHEAQGLSKDETVYVLAGADGTAQKVIVSDWIRNPGNEDSITDCSALSDIEVVKGDASFTQNGEDCLIWEAGGSDLYYQGTTDRELPVALTVSYTLDGETVSAEELTGQSGRVTIRFDYENHQCETVKIAEKDEQICVPFCVLTGMLLDSDVFRNVEVSNGKLLNDGDRIAVIGAAFPGLQESLGIDRNTLTIPDYLEITADVTGFEPVMAMTVAANTIFRDLDPANLDSSDDLAASLTELTDGIGQLMEGAGALDDGTGQLTAGMAELSCGLDTLKSNNDALNGGAKQIFESLLSTAETQIKAGGVPIPALTVENYAEVLDGVLTSLGIPAISTEAMTPEEAKAMLAAVPDAAKSLLALKESLDSYNTFYLGLLSYTEGVSSAADGAAALAAGASELKNGTAQLADGTGALYEGISSLESKLFSVINGDPEALLSRTKAIIEASQQYQNFSGITDTMDGQVKFIYRVNG